MNALGVTRKCAMIALVAALVMFFSATGAYAGGRDSSFAQQQWSDSSNSWDQSDTSVDNSQSWGDQNSSDQADSSDSSGQNGDQQSTDCKKNESQSSEQGQQTGPTEAANGPTGQSGQESASGQESPKQKGETGNEVKGEQNKAKEIKQQTPAQVTPMSTAPTVVPTQTQTAPAVVAPSTTPVTTPVETQQAPAPSGQVQSKTQKTTGGKKPAAGPSVLASTQTTQVTAAKSTSGGLASTGFDAWLVALIGFGFVACAGLLLRRTRRS